MTDRGIASFCLVVVQLEQQLSGKASVGYTAAPAIGKNGNTPNSVSFSWFRMPLQIATSIFFIRWK